MGANMAILDACDLGQGLIAGIKDSVGLEWVLKSYEDKIIARGREQVLASRATGESDDPLEISGGRLQKLRMMELAAREGGSL
jgi:2-polyprenyl-6-methoxyphenol hydroxylase-like FAD-dependent oxidoreductase